MDAKQTAVKTPAKPIKPIGIYARLHSAKQLIGKVAKNATNPHFKKNYADINALLETVEPVLWDNGLVLLQPIKDDVVMTQIVDIETGEMVESWMRLPMITDPQKVLSAVTYFRRGTLQSLLSLQAVDDDGQTAAAAPKGKPAITNDRFEKALQAISDNQYTVEQLQATYSLTDLQLKAIQL
jgi:hypothetical protein